jgi:hypothetical protein
MLESLAAQTLQPSLLHCSSGWLLGLLLYPLLLLTPELLVLFPQQ